MIAIFFFLAFMLYFMLKIALEDYLNLRRIITHEVKDCLSRVEHIYKPYQYESTNSH